MFLPYSANAFEPALYPASNTGEIPDRGGTDSRIFDEKDSVAVLGETGHNLLVALPDEIPVNRRNANYILIL